MNVIITLTLVLVLVTSSCPTDVNRCPELKNCVCKSLIITCKKMKNVSELFPVLHQRFHVIDRLFISKTEVGAITPVMFSNLTISVLFIYKGNVSQVEDLSLVNVNGLINVKLQYGTLKAVPRDIRWMPALLSLSLSHNLITNLTRSDLRSATGLVHLDLSYNRLMMVDRSALKGFRNLINLFLNNNMLKIIYSGTFNDLIQLNWINLSHNRIISFNGLFSNMNPKKFILNWNKVSSLTGVFDRYMYFATFMDLSRNKLISIQSSDLAHKFPRLSELHLYQTNLKSLSPGQFKGLQSIQRIHLNHNQFTTLPENVFQPMMGIEYIELSYNMLTSVDGLFANLFFLKILQLKHNRIQNISSGALRKLRSLELLDLSFNRLETISKDDFNGTYNLKTLFLYNNRLRVLGNTVFSTMPRLTRIDLHRNKIVSVGKSFAQLGFLTELILKSNRLTAIDETMFGRSQYMDTVDLSSNHLNSIGKAFCRISKLNWLDLSVNNLTTLDRPSFCNTPIKYLKLQRNKWKCDCRMNWLMDLIHVKHQVFIKDRPDCSGPTELKYLPLAQLNSTLLNNWKHNCPQGCRCQCHANDFEFYVTTNCSLAGLQKFPQTMPDKTRILDLSMNNISKVSKEVLTYNKVISMNLSGNQIGNLKDLRLPAVLQELSLVGNKLTEVSGSSLDILDTLRNVKLAGNPWKCGCDSILFRNWLLHNISKVKDVHDVRCNNEKENGKLYGEVIIELGTFDLCPEQLIILVCISGILGSLLIGTISKVMYNRYSIYIRMWLYSRRLCTCLLCIKPPDDDEDDSSLNHRFDAFISYSSLDYDFVMNDIVKVMDEKHPQYNICIHDRHFNPTRDIGDNILSAIQCSKRIILILSNNFLESSWCIYEFKAAFFEALEKRRNRIMIVVVGELPPMEDINPDLKMYLETTTYLKWSDRNFWEKFLFVLPRVTQQYSPAERRSLLLQETEIVTSDEFQPLINN